MAIVLDGTGSITGLTSGAGIAAAALSGQVPDANAPSGSVIQVVQAVKTDRSTVSGTFGADILSVSITPSSASSKILIMASMSFGGDTGPNYDAVFAFYRNGDVIDGARANADGNRTRGTFSGLTREQFELSNGVGIYLDSPASVSSQTYSIRVSCSGTIAINGSIYNDNAANVERGISTITAMEIAP
jgi:hypothetical protein